MCCENINEMSPTIMIRPKKLQKNIELFMGLGHKCLINRIKAVHLVYKLFNQFMVDLFSNEDSCRAFELLELYSYMVIIITLPIE